MIMNQDDARRYQKLRELIVCAENGDDGEYRPILPFMALPRAKTLDASIDKAMGVEPTHEPLEPVFTVDEVVGLLIDAYEQDDGDTNIVVAGVRVVCGKTNTTEKIKAALLKLKETE